MSQRCVILYGLMGAGKSAVGESLAETIGYDFLDTDDLVVKRAGKPIPQIFAEEGEAHFRQLETEVIGNLAGAQGKVIATGGGAVVDPQNRHVLQSLGLTVYLKASPRELYQRIKNDSNRPLIANQEEPKAVIERLLKERGAHYQEADIVIDTEDLTVEEVTDKLIDELARRTQGDG